jgi:hypothetical protein
VSFREAAILIFSHWLAGLGEPQLRCRHLERPFVVAAAARLFSMPSKIALRLPLAHGYTPLRFSRRVRMRLLRASSRMPSHRRLLIFTGGDY